MLRATLGYWALGLLISIPTLAATETHPLIIEPEQSDNIPTYDLHEETLRANRSPAVLGPATDQPVVENSAKYLEYELENFDTQNAESEDTH